MSVAGVGESRMSVAASAPRCEIRPKRKSMLVRPCGIAPQIPVGGARVGIKMAQSQRGSVSDSGAGQGWYSTIMYRSGQVLLQT